MITVIAAQRAWDTYYTGESTMTYTREKGRILISQSESIYIKKCYFSKLYTEGCGSSIFIEDTKSLTETKLLVESSSFLDCRATMFGGAIFFNTRGQSVFSLACVFN